MCSDPTTSENSADRQSAGSRAVSKSSDGGDNVTMGSGYYQHISVLVFRGQPRDTQGSRVAKLCITFNGDEDTNMTFELIKRPQPRLEAVMNKGPPSTKPHFERKIEVAVVSTASERDTGLRDAIQGIIPNPEWDSQNWIDDVLRALQSVWPTQILEDDVTYAVNHTVDVICQGPDS
jgi:hypothetical protein